MKTNLIKTTCLLALCSIIFGCSSNSDSGCQPIECQNGGTFINCSCDCPVGFTGTDCSSEIPPKKVIVKKAILRAFPNTESNGDSWDLGIPTVEDQLPDVYITFTHSNNVIATSDSYYGNVLSDSSTMLGYDFNLELTDFSTPYIISVWDYDGSNAADFMTSYGFFAYTSNQGFPDVITVFSQSDKIWVDLEVSYQW